MAMAADYKKMMDYVFQIYIKTGIFIAFTAHFMFAQSSFHCNIFNPACRQNIQHQENSLLIQNQLFSQTRKSCNFQDIWLIPGRADASCTRLGAKRHIEVDPRYVSISPSIIKFPGCFTVEIKNIRINDHEEILSNSLFAKSEYQWLNLKEFSYFKCQNASSNGCGGFGNNCYYCDICQNLKNIKNTSSFSTSTLSEQFRGLSCPQRAGYYTFHKEFCFNDWSIFDTNGDCQIDFLDTSEKSNIKAAFSSLQQIGFGTIIAKIRLAFNATKPIEQRKTVKEIKIERTVQQELEQRRRTWNINKTQFDRFQRWYVDYRKNVWHREEYLPWLLYENEFSCLRLTFDVCERAPRRRKYGNKSNQQGYTCD